MISSKIIRKMKIIIKKEGLGRKRKNTATEDIQIDRVIIVLRYEELLLWSSHFRLVNALSWAQEVSHGSE